MRFIYNEEKIQKLLRAVSGLTGISIAFLNPEGVFLYNSAKEGDFCSRIQCDVEHRYLCDCSDRELLQNSHKSGKYECHICYAGLYDAAIPMIKNGMLAGSVIMGRIRSSNSPAAPYITTDPELVALYKKIPKFKDSQLEDLRILLPNILFESAIEVESDSLMDSICDYVDQNLSTDLHLQDLCNQFHISKNVLYQRFRQRFNCTVNCYISDRRIDLAKQLLVQTDTPIYTIAEQTGLGSGTYFCRLFKKKTTMSPAEYRKKGRISNHK